MSLPTYDLNLLKSYKALLISRTLSEAAERACLSQPAMSRALDRLQLVFNDQLFITGRNGIVPTPLSVSLKEQVLDIVNKLGTLPSEKVQFDPLQSNYTFNVYCSDIFMSNLASPILTQIIHDGFSVKINLLPSYLVTQSNNASDAAENPDLLIIGAKLNKTEINGTKILKARYKEFYNIENSSDLESTYLKLIVTGKHGSSAIDEYFKKSGLKRKTHDCFSISQLLLLLNSQVQMKCLLPEIFEPLTKSFAKIGISNTSDFKLSEDYYMYWPVQKENDAKNIWLREFVNRLINQIM